MRNYYRKVEVSNSERKANGIRIEKWDVSIVSDFTYPDSDWDSLSLNSNHEIIFDILVELNLIQLVSTPTHIKSTILDIVGTSNSNILEVFVLDHPISDHYPVNFTIVVKTFKAFPSFQLKQNPNHRFTKIVLMTPWVQPINFSSVRLI